MPGAHTLRSTSLEHISQEHIPGNTFPQEHTPGSTSPSEAHPWEHIPLGSTSSQIRHCSRALSYTVTNCMADKHNEKLPVHRGKKPGDLSCRWKRKTEPALASHKTQPLTNFISPSNRHVFYVECISVIGRKHIVLGYGVPSALGKQRQVAL